jgi:hypothetical protein
MGSSELRLYDVTVGAHRTQMRLNEDDAEAMGGTPAAAPPPASGTAAPAPPPVDSKNRLVTSNKMRGTTEADAHTERGGSISPNG